MIYFILSLLIISQFVTFYLIFNKVKPIIKPKGILLKPIPRSIKYDDVDKNYQTVKDVLESIKLEDWKVDIIFNTMIYDSYEISVISNSNDITIKCRISYDSGDESSIPFLGYFIISDQQSKSISIDRELSSPINNDIIEFFWDYIVEYHNSLNNQQSIMYKKSITSITSKLKALSRSRKLNEIIK